MASSSSSSSDVLHEFMKEVKQVEASDSIYTSSTQIARLLRPGSSYANLNPFEVLILDAPSFDASSFSSSSQESEDSINKFKKFDFDVVKKQYKKLSMLVHPDKNRDNTERAQAAFDIITKAYKQLEDEKSRNHILEMIEEAAFKWNQEIEEKRRKARKNNLSRIPEDESPAVAASSLRAATLKLFADSERKKKGLEERAAAERKRKREEEIAAEEAKRAKAEYEKNYEASREVRVSSWQSFNKKTSSKKGDKNKKEGSKFQKGIWKPPKPKPETH